MIHVQLDAVGGIAGDMFVAALLDAFPELRARVLADAAAILPAEAGAPQLEVGESGHVKARRFGLAAPGAGDHRHEAAHASFRDLSDRIGRAKLSPGTATEAIAILTILAEAEAEIHSVAVEDVHFHEIGDWDSLVDVVAAGSIVAALPDAAWTVSPLPRGEGLVPTRHGLLPVPAPATALILKGFAWRDDGVGGERVTPTGAAILKHIVRATPAAALGRLVASGTGAGTRVLPGMPNILRALIFDDARTVVADQVTVLSFEVDDMSGEEIGVAAEHLRAEPGVVDLSIGQRFGKKGRPVQSFRLVVRGDARAAIVDRCFAETSTIGLRLREEARVVLSRETGMVGGVRVKSVERPGAERTAKAESDDLGGGSLAARRALKLKVERGDR